VLIYLVNNGIKDIRIYNKYSSHFKKILTEAKPIDTKPVENGEETQKKCEEKCVVPKPLGDQLFEQKQLYEELKLKVDDTSPPYRYSTTDRYIIDTGVDPVADDKLAFKMKDTGSRAQEAADSRSLYGKNSLLPFIEEEMEEHANSYGWWDDEDLEQVF
jgi:hypothetical protein